MNIFFKKWGCLTKYEFDTYIYNSHTSQVIQPLNINSGVALEKYEFDKKYLSYYISHY